MAAWLAGRAPVLRTRILRAIASGPSGHPGGSLSVVDILATVMLGWGRFAPTHDPRDWLVLAKGHAAPALYAVLVELGHLDEKELATYRRLGSRLQGHPDHRKLPVVGVTTGHLGQGLSIAVGLALGLRRRTAQSQTYAVLGDGDLHEGQTWEAAMAASHFQLSNLTVLVDLNRLTQHGPVPSIMNHEPIAAKWRAFGWWVTEVDGHDHAAVLQALRLRAMENKPAAILCRTVKGKGVWFMEDDPLWHSGQLSEQELAQALASIESGR